MRVLRTKIVTFLTKAGVLQYTIFEPHVFIYDTAESLWKFLVPPRKKTYYFVDGNFSVPSRILINDNSPSTHSNTFLMLVQRSNY